MKQKTSRRARVRRARPRRAHDVRRAIFVESLSGEGLDAPAADDGDGYDDDGDLAVRDVVAPRKNRPGQRARQARHAARAASARPARADGGRRRARRTTARARKRRARARPRRSSGSARRQRSSIRRSRAAGRRRAAAARRRARGGRALRRGRRSKLLAPNSTLHRHSRLHHKPQDHVWRPRAGASARRKEEGGGHSPRGSKAGAEGQRGRQARIPVAFAGSKLARFAAGAARAALWVRLDVTHEGRARVARCAPMASRARASRGRGPRAPHSMVVTACYDRVLPGAGGRAAAP